MKLWLVRHPPVLLEAGHCYGALDLAADSEASRQCALALAAVLPQQAHVSSSPLQRCEQLAQVLIGLRPDLTLSIDARLREMDFGSWEGRRWADISRKEFDAWMADFGAHTVGGHGESVNALMDRVAQAYDELQRTPKPAPDQVWITHAGVIRATDLLDQGLRQLTRADQWPVDGVACGQWRCLALS